MIVLLPDSFGFLEMKIVEESLVHLLLMVKDLVTNLVEVQKVETVGGSLVVKDLMFHLDSVPL